MVRHKFAYVYGLLQIFHYKKNCTSVYKHSNSQFKSQLHLKIFLTKILASFIGFCLEKLLNEFSLSLEIFSQFFRII